MRKIFTVATVLVVAFQPQLALSKAVPKVKSAKTPSSMSRSQTSIMATPAAWAECFWDKVPTSTSNWLALPAANYIGSDRNDDVAQKLGIRLISACYRSFYPVGNPKPENIPLAEARAVAASVKPASVSPDSVEPNAYDCTLTFKDYLLGYDWGFGKPESLNVIIRTRFVPTELADRSPPDLPKPDAVKCRLIKEDGSLADA